MAAATIMTTTFFNEMYDAAGAVRSHYQAYADWLAATPEERIARKRAEADIAFHRVGITFAVYGEEAGKERLQSAGCQHRRQGADAAEEQQDRDGEDRPGD